MHTYQNIPIAVTEIERHISLKLKKIELKSPKEVYQQVHSISQNHLQPVILGYKT